MRGYEWLEFFVLFWFEIESHGKHDEYALIQYMECTDVDDGADDVLSCVRLRRSIDNEVGHSLKETHGGKNSRRK